MAFHRFKDMDLVKQVHVFGLSNVHTFEINDSLISLFSLIFNNAKPRLRMILLRHKFAALPNSL